MKEKIQEMLGKIKNVDKKALLRVGLIGTAAVVGIVVVNKLAGEEEDFVFEEIVPESVEELKTE